MRVMGLDFGSKTVGVAISDPLFVTAQGIEIIRRKVYQDSGRLQPVLLVLYYSICAWTRPEQKAGGCVG